MSIGRARRGEFAQLGAAGWDVTVESPIDRLRAVLQGWWR